jgi:hypothetical protein
MAALAKRSYEVPDWPPVGPFERKIPFSRTDLLVLHFSYYFCYFGLPRQLFAAPSVVIRGLLTRGGFTLLDLAANYLHTYKGINHYERSEVPPPHTFLQFQMQMTHLSAPAAALFFTYPSPSIVPGPKPGLVARLLHRFRSEVPAIPPGLQPYFGAIHYDRNDLSRFAVYVLSRDGFLQVIGEGRYRYCFGVFEPGSVFDAFVSFMNAQPLPPPLTTKDSPPTPPSISNVRPSKGFVAHSSYHFCDYGIPQKLFTAPNIVIESLLMSGVSHLRQMATIPTECFRQFTMHVRQVNSSALALIITYPPPIRGENSTPVHPHFSALLFDPKDLTRLAVYVLGGSIGCYTPLWLVQGRDKYGNCAYGGKPTLVEWCTLPLGEWADSALDDFTSLLRSQINS